MKPIFHLILALFLFLAPPAFAKEAPVISADAAIIMDAESGKILYEKNGEKKEYPASLTKMVTCLLSLEKGDPYKMLAISRNAANVESTWLYGGEWIRLGDLTYQMMLLSDNGAATAIAEAIGGNVNAFADMMNDKAKAIGCKGTHFVNANGMPDVNHYSTAKDLALIAKYGLENPKFRAIVGTKTKKVHYEKPRQNLTCGNTNELLYSYDGAIGVKTGYTRAAGGCLSAAATRNGKTLIVIVLHSRDYDSRFKEAAALLDYGFGL